MSVDVYPSMGFKTAGLCYKGEWLQPYQPDWSPLLQKETFGNTVLFPTPNRVRNGVFSMECISFWKPSREAFCKPSTVWRRVDPGA